MKLNEARGFLMTATIDIQYIYIYNQIRYKILDMELSQQGLPIGKLLKLSGVAILGVAVNYLINKLMENNSPSDPLKDLKHDVFVRSNKRTSTTAQKRINWGQYLIQNIPEDDDLLIQLRMMSSLTSQIQKIPNLIVDLQFAEYITLKNPIVAYSNKQKKEEPYMNPKSLTQPGSFIINNAQIKTGQLLSFSKKWLRAGARKTIYFNPSQVKAAIVTCGGLCPGINTIIKQLVVCLQYNYKVPTIYGFKYSFKGMLNNQWVLLNSSLVKVQHHYGGSYLGINREVPDVDNIISKLVEGGINQLYIIGGEGSLILCTLLHEKIKEKRLNIAVCTIVKSITNDLPIFDSTFGFETALEETQRAIEAAYVQSHSHENGVAIVKVLGKRSGFLAMQSCLAARNVHVCLVPQFGFQVKGDRGLFNYVYQRLKQRGHILIVVAEGCTESVRDLNLKTVGNQINGDPIKEDIGLTLKKQLIKYLSTLDISFTVKYIDPTYMIRAVPPNPYDTKICCQVAQSSIHGMMAGYTGFACGHVTNKNVMIPIHEILSGNYSNKILRHSPDWQRLLATTGQPSFINNEEKYMRRY